MRAVILDGPQQFTVREVETPQADGNKVLIKINRVGICGSDLHMWRAGELKGLIMGHEFCGTVIDPGALKGSLKTGDRVTAFPMNPCGTCSACKMGMINMCETGMANIMGAGFPGAYGEYFAARPDMVKRLPDSRIRGLFPRSIFINSKKPQFWGLHLKCFLYSTGFARISRFLNSFLFCGCSISI